MAQRAEPKGVLDVIPRDPSKRILANKTAYQDTHGDNSCCPSASILEPTSPGISPHEKTVLQFGIISTRPLCGERQS